MNLFGHNSQQPISRMINAAIFRLTYFITFGSVFVTSVTPKLTNSALSRSLTIPKKVEDYVILTSEQIEGQLSQWALDYPHLTRLTTSQDKYKLPRAGGPHDCPFVEGDGCPNSILTVQDFVAHPEGSDSSNRLPEVFWSGEVHGNERVGPTSVMKAVDLLLRATSCLALPRLSVRQQQPWTWEAEVEQARKCRQDFEDFGIAEQDLWWLGRLVSTRRIVVVPTANSLGYFRSSREEAGIDPNRDFPYDYLQSSENPEFNTQCMQTIAGRTLNEVFREHMFQLSLTFHGGMEAIGYEWGAPTYNKLNISPDDIVQNQVAAAYSRFGGSWSGKRPYEYGPMNTLVYPVRGGMEDWAYAGSWDPARVIPCKPNTYTEYDVDRTKYNNATLRVLNMLVETSDHKIPNPNELGSSADLLKGFSTVGNGHVSRNIRLALLSAELVEPWLSIRRVNGVPLLDDTIPLMDRSGRSSCQNFKEIAVPCFSTVVIEWSVGGSLHINESKLWYARWSDVPDLDCLNQPNFNARELMMEGVPISSTMGKTRFSTSGLEQTKSNHFSASLDLASFHPDDKIVVMASARVDQDWGTQPEPYEPTGLRPQSHMANVRTNPNWFYQSGDKVVQGRVDWFSSPLTIVMGNLNNTADAVELSLRLPLHTGRPWSSSATNISEGNVTSMGVCIRTSRSSWASLQWAEMLLLVVTFFALVAIVMRCLLNERIRHGQRKRVRRFIADESAPPPGSHQFSDAEDFEEPEQYHDEVEDRNGVEMERYG